MTSADGEVAALAAALQDSEHVRYVQRCAALFSSSSSSSFHPLSPAEIDLLQRNNNHAEDWQRVRKMHRDLAIDAERIRDCEFQGFVVLGHFSGSIHLSSSSSVSLRSGCFRSLLRNAVVLDNALVKDTLLLSDALVDEFACVLGCGQVDSSSSSSPSSFSSGRTIHVGVEVGGRDVRIFAELPFALAARVVTERGNVPLLQQYNALVDAYTVATQSPCSIIASHARVIRCSTLEASFVGHYAVVEDAELRHSTLLSTKDEPSSITGKSVVRHAIVQWNSTVDALAFVDGALLCDTTHVDRHGIVMSAIIGPNTGVAEGEVTSSLVGPFVGFHHQALLIASVWPEGRGNVGYGANVGSNHTLKAPDQELLPGEGTFFGLGCCVKFPSNLQCAPYSVIATGVSTLPQKLEMPFALINTPGHNIAALSPAINEISPAWVLRHSVFTVLRNERKFATRNKSKRTAIDGAVFRPDIVKCMIEARRRLRDAEGKAKILLPKTNEPIFTDAQVPGLGKNYMRETARIEAIEAYTFFIQLYALEQGLLLAVEAIVDAGGVMPTEIGQVPSDLYAVQVLKEEFPATLWVLDALQDLVARRRHVVKDAVHGKARDDARGKRIVADYALVHAPVETEAAVQYAVSVADETQRRVARFVARM